jgi:hypothetical protein
MFSLSRIRQLLYGGNTPENNMNYKEWLNKRCIQNISFRYSKKLVYSDYQEYCNKKKYIIIDTKTFDIYLKENNIIINRDEYYYGIGLKH